MLLHLTAAAPGAIRSVTQIFNIYLQMYKKCSHPHHIVTVLEYFSYRCHGHLSGSPFFEARKFLM